MDGSPTLCAATQPEETREEKWEGEKIETIRSEGEDRIEEGERVSKRMRIRYVLTQNIRSIRSY